MPNFETTYEQDKWDNLVKQADKSAKKIRSKKGRVEDLELVETIMREFSETTGAAMEDLTENIKKQAKKKAKQKQKGKRVDPGKFKADCCKELQNLINKRADEIADLIESLLKGINDKLDALREGQEAVLEDTSTILDILRQRCDDQSEGEEGEDDDDDFQGSPMSMFAGDDESPEDLLDRMFGDDDAEQEEAVDEFADKLSKKLGKGAGLGFAGDDTNTVKPASHATYLEQLTNHNNSIAELLDKMKKGEIPEVDPKKEERKANSWLRSLKGSWLGKKLGKAYDSGKGFLSGLLDAGFRFLLTSLMSGELLQTISDYLDMRKLKEYGLAFYETMKSNVKGFVSYIADKLDFAGKAKQVESWWDQSVQEVNNSITNVQDAFIESYRENMPSFLGGKTDQERKDELDAIMNPVYGPEVPVVPPGGFPTASSNAVPQAGQDFVSASQATMPETQNNSVPSVVAANGNMSSTNIEGGVTDNSSREFNPSVSMDNSTTVNNDGVSVPTVTPASSAVLADPEIQQVTPYGIGSSLSSSGGFGFPAITSIPLTSPDAGLGMLTSGALAS